LLFLLCAIYALSAANLIIKLPLLKTAMYSISILCIFRGLATITLSLTYPEMVSGFSILAGATWFFFWIIIFSRFSF